MNAKQLKDSIGLASVFCGECGDASPLGGALLARVRLPNQAPGFKLNRWTMVCSEDCKAVWESRTQLELMAPATQLTENDAFP